LKNLIALLPWKKQHDIPSKKPSLGEMTTETLLTTASSSTSSGSGGGGTTTSTLPTILV